MSKKWVAEGKKVSKKDWSQISERLTCCEDLLELFHQDSNLSIEFKSEIRHIQTTMAIVANKVFKKSLSKKERLEVYGK